MAFSVSIWFVDDQMAQQLYGGSKDFFLDVKAFENVIPDAVVYAVFCSIGVWYGRRHRISRYLSFVIGFLPTGKRTAVVERIRDEAMGIPPGARTVG